MYYIVFLIGIVLSSINDKKNVSLKIFALILSFLAYFRYGVGADYFSYEFLYRITNESLITELRYGLGNEEILFRLMGSLFKNIGFSYQHQLIIIATINIYYIYKICKKYSKNPTLSLLIYYCFYYFVWTFSGLRQGLTLVIGVYYLLECLENKKPVKLFLVTIILSMVHMSAIILIPLYLSTKISVNRNKLFFLLCIAIVTSLIPMGKIVTKLTWIPLMHRIAPYLSSDSSIINIFNFKSLGRIIFVAIGFFYYNSFSHKDDISKRIITIYISSIILYFFLKFSELTASRIAEYGMILSILILPNAYYMHKSKLDKLIYLTCLCVLCTLYFNKELQTMERQAGLVNENKVIVPYTNIHNNDKYVFIKWSRFN